MCADAPRSGRLRTVKRDLGVRGCQTALMPNHSLSTEALAARTERAVAAATTSARALGLDVGEPKVLHDVFSVVVHLAPSPVVVRVPAVLPRGLTAAEQQARQMRELAAVSWLAEQGVPVVRPSPLLPTAPAQRDGFSMTFWELVDATAQGEADMLPNTELVPQLHAALRRYHADLPFLAPVSVSVPTCLKWLADHPGSLAEADLRRAQREWQTLAPLLSSRRAFEAAFPRASVQAVHGDAPFYNVIHTPSGALYADFEDVTLGPPEWDLAGIGPEYAEAYNAAAGAAGVRPLQEDVLRLMSAARNLQLVACIALVPELPLLATGLSPMLEAWRSSPFAGGFN
jgi:aminoglycoside phosphotransferase (APT) family kinase protein